MTPPAMTPDSLEATIAAWMPEEAVDAFLFTRYPTGRSGGLRQDAYEMERLRQGLAAYQRAIAPLLARAVEAMREAKPCVAHKQSEWPLVVCGDCWISMRVAFHAVLTQAKPEGRGK